MKAIIITILVTGCITVVYTVFRSKKVLRSITRTVFQGIASLMAVNVVGLFTGVTIAVNWYTVICVCIFGMPAAISLLILDTIFR